MSRMAALLGMLVALMHAAPAAALFHLAHISEVMSGTPGNPNLQYVEITVDNNSQNLVSNTPNHVGVVCTNGTGCSQGTRNLLDLFQVAIDPQNGDAAIIYTDDTLTTSTASGNFACMPNQTTCPLPQVVLAQQQ